MADYTHLTYLERHQIALLLGHGKKITEIAKHLGRHRSNIYRELKRNSKDDLYSPSIATQMAKLRHRSPLNKLDVNATLHQYVVQGLENGWAPEQISGRMIKEKRSFYVCHESIYRYLYRNKDQRLYLLLHKKRQRRLKRTERKMNKKPLYIASHNICYRPPEIELRKQFGHWEGDTVRFQRGQKACVTTLVERKSRIVRLIKNKDGRSNTVIGHICDVIKQMPPKLWSTLTVDQGTEFSHFYQLLRTTKSAIYFCDTHSPWQRGSNENFNGRLRRYLPTNTLIDQLSEEALQIIENRLNNTPRKCLNYQTPSEVFMQHYRACRTSL